MKLRSVLLMATMAAVSFMGLSVGSTAALAHDSGPVDACVEPISRDWGYTCFQRKGDDQWVYDRAGNGWGVVVQVQTNYGKIRWCADPHAAGSWHECVYDHREDSCVRYRMFEQLGDDNTQTRNWTGWSPLIPVGNNVICVGVAEPTGSQPQRSTAH